MPTESTATADDQARADAACLLQVIAPEDLPAGVLVVDLGCPPGDIQGLCIGTGHAWARLHGDRAGRQAVGVAVTGIRQTTGGRFVDVFVDHIGLHEAAHLVWQTEDVTEQRVQAMVADIGQHLPRLSDPSKRASSHSLLWAATLTVMAARAEQYRPRTAAALRMLTDHDLASYGWSHAALRSCLLEHDTGDSITTMLDASSTLMRGLLATQLHHERPLQTQAPAQHGADAAACGAMR